MQTISKLTSQAPLARCGRMNDSDTAIPLWIELDLKVLNKHAPELMTKVRKGQSHGLLRKLQDIKNKKDRLREYAKKLNCERAWENCKAEKKAAKTAVNNIKDNFFKKLLEDNKNYPKQIWNNLKRIMPKGSK